MKRKVKAWLLAGGAIALVRAIFCLALALIMAQGGESGEAGFVMIADFPTVALCRLAYKWHLNSRGFIDSPLQSDFFLIGEAAWFLIGGALGAIVSLTCCRKSLAAGESSQGAQESQ